MAAGRGAGVRGGRGREHEAGRSAFAKAAEEAGCDAVMAVPPLTTRLTRSGTWSITSGPWPTAIGHPADRAGRLELRRPGDPARRVREAARAVRPGEDRSSSRRRRRSGRTSPPCATRPAGRRRIFEGSGGIFLIDSYRRGDRRHDAGDGPARRRRRRLAGARARRRGDGVSRLLPRLRRSWRCNCRPGSTGSWRSRST